MAVYLGALSNGSMRYLMQGLCLSFATKTLNKASLLDLLESMEMLNLDPWF